METSTSVKSEIKRQVSSAFQRNFESRYENLTKQIMETVLESLVASKHEILQILTSNSSSFSSIVDEKWEEYERLSPGKLKTDTSTKQRMIVKDIDSIQQNYLDDYLKQFHQVISSKIGEAKISFEDNIKSQEMSELDSATLLLIKTRSECGGGHSQPSPKRISESMDDLIDAGLEEADEFVTSGPFSKDDFVFHDTIKKDDQLHKFEKGILAHKFSNSLSDNRYNLEFKALEKITKSKVFLGMKLENPSWNYLNRYSDVLPYKTNCIRLLNKRSTDSYINASWVGSNMAFDNKAFIATQAPLENTFNDFWQMVLQENVEVIVMLCKLKADNRVQSYDYFSENSKNESSLFQITDQRVETVAPNLVKRTLTLKYNKGQNQRKIVHFQWTGWPDHGVPGKHEFATLAVLIREMRSAKSRSRWPIVVHCR